MRRRVPPSLYAAACLLAMGYGVMFSALDDFRDEYGISEAALGVVVSLGFFTSFLGQLFLAPLADRGRARHMLLGGFGLATVGTLGMAFGANVAELFAARLVMGLGIGMCLPALRRTIIMTDPDHVGANLGRSITYDVFGFALGPVVAALTIGPLGIRAPFLIVTAIMAAVLFALSRVAVTESTGATTERFAFDLLRVRPVAGAILIGLALFVLIGTFDSLWSLVMDDMDAPTWIANVGIIVFVVPMVILGSVGGRLAEKHGPFRWAAGGLLVGAACTFWYGVLPAPWMMLCVGALHGINDGLTITGTGVAVAWVAPPERTASAQGLLGGLQTLVGGLTAVAAGASYDAFGRLFTFSAATVVMVVMVVSGYALAGPARQLRRSPAMAAKLPVPA